MAVNCCAVPVAMVGLVGVTDMDCSIAAVTVRVVDAVVIPSVATIVVVPTAFALATPELLIVAISGFEELQLICVVRSFVEWSEVKPVALHCRVVPLATMGLVGVISTGCNDEFVSFVLPPPPPQAERKMDAEKNNTKILWLNFIRPTSQELHRSLPGGELDFMV